MIIIKMIFLRLAEVVVRLLMYQHILPCPIQLEKGVLKMSEIDCDRTNEIVCPYCGHKHTDSLEMTDGEEDTTSYCYSCNKEFEVSSHVSVNFSTRKMVDKCQE